MSMYRFVKEGSSKRLFVQGTIEGEDAKPLKSSLKKSSPSPVGSPITTSLNLASVPRSLRDSLTKHETVYDGNYPGMERSSSYRSGSFREESYNGRIVHDGNQTHFEYDGERALAVPMSAGGSGMSELQAIHTNKRMSTEVLGSSLESTKISKKDDSGQRRITTRIVRKVTTLTRGEEKASAEDVRGGREVHRSAESYRHYEVEATPSRKVKISDIVVGQEPNVTAREALLSWARRSTAKYPGVRVADFTSSWRDGLAFNALIHRNRPDLIDWRNIRSRQVRERLETAFHIVEKEYGVTRLLDPEDVDTHEPDEKSLITYISSLYETFPEPPSVHPLFDAESQRRAAGYTEQAAQHRAWLHEKCSLMQDRAFPSTLIEMKKLLSESTRFRNEEVPLRQREKQKLFHLYRELEKYFESVGEIEIEPTLRPEALEQAWSRLLMAHQERERDLADEIRRLERLQRLAEKLHRDIKQTEGSLDNIERHIESEIRRLERGVHPAEAKQAAESIEHELRATEHTITEMMHDAHALRDGRYPQAAELLRRVQQVHERWLAARAAFTGRLVPRLSSVRMPVQQTTVRRETRTVLETRVHDADPKFQQLHDATRWCKEKLKKLHESEYGSDLPTVQHELDKHQREHKQIDQFHSKVEQCVHNRANFSGEELTLYNQHLSQLQKLYAELLSTSTKRMSDLDALQDFLQSATAELNWLNEKEQVELSRDWADPHINLPAVQHYYEQLMSSLEKRELQFSNVIDRGEALIAQHHPALKTIESHLQVMQSQWAWVLQLTLCLETHLKHTTQYHNFFEEVKEAEKWIQKREEALNTTFSQSEFTLDQGERLLKGMQELREELNEQGGVVARLADEAANVRPIRMRRAPITRPLRAETVCAYKHANVAVEKGSAVSVTDNSGRSRWRVRLGGAGTEAQLPAAVIALPPPCQEAIDAAARLRSAYDRVIQLWQRKQLRMRQNMIFATIKVVKGWDFPQFVAMGAEQRQAIRRALNEDAEKLLGEGDPADPQLRRLRREIDEVNRLFDEFERRARAEEDSKNAARIFTEQSSNLLERLEVFERQLNERIASHIPRDLDSLEHLVLQHKDWETSLHGLAADVEEVQDTFRGIALKTPAMKKNLDKVMGKWNDMQSKSQLFVERLKYVEIVVNSMEENNQTISEFEIKLAQFSDLPNDVELLKDIHEDLLRMQVAVSKQQTQVEQMNDDAENCRRLVESSRAALHTSLPRRHQDLERMDKDVSALNTRWNNVCAQLADRLRSCEAAYQLLKNYNAGYEKEAEWIEDTYSKLQAQPPIEIRPKEQLEPTRNLLTSVVERTPKIEKVNVDGGRFIREGKIHTSRCQRYVEWLCEEIHPSLDTRQLRRQADIEMADRMRNRGRTDVVPGAEIPSGAETVARELDELNAKHQRLLDLLYERLRRIAAANPGDIVTLRLVEAMAPRSARSFRQEFNMQDVATTEHTYTTHYTSEKFIRTSHSTELDGHVQTKSMTNGKLSSPNYTTKTIIGDDDRPDIRNLKRVHKMYEGPNIIESKGIVHPETKEILTVGQAISMRILDVRTGRLLSSPETRKTITIEQAAKEGLIDAKLASRLTGPCGMTEDGNEVTLLEAIQRELYDAEQGFADPAEKRIKVTVKGEALSQGMSISDALTRGQVDLEKGLYKLPDGTYITIAEAYQRGYLVYNEIIKIKSSALSLSDAINQDLVDNSGWILDRNSGDRFQLDVAIQNELINPGVREIVDPKNDTKITLTEAITKNIINTMHSKYIHNITKDKLSYKEAASKGYICKPMTLKDICDNGLMTNDGKILSLTNRTPLNILEAISAGVLDSENIKCITDTTSGQLLTLSEALGSRIILPENRFRDNLTGEICSIPEAVDRGLITSVSQRSIFDIDGFRDPKTGEFISFNVALSKGYLKYANGETFLKSESGDFVFLEDCPKVSIIRPEVLEMFNRKIGVFENKKELSVLDAVFKNILDPKTGFLLESSTKKPIPFNKAVEMNMITPEGAALLNSLLNITLTLQTVTKTIKRYVTVTNSNTVRRSETIITFAEAIRRGLIDETTQTFTDPTTGTVFPIQQALDNGLLGVDKDEPRVTRISDRVTKKELVPGQVVELKITKKSFIKDLPPSPESKLHRDNKPETLKSPDYIVREDSQPRQDIIYKTSTSKSVVSDPSVTSLTINKNTIELPRGGWSLRDAIEQKLYDPHLGIFVIPGTDRVLDLQESIKLNVINPDSAKVLDAKTNKTVSLHQALELHLLDSTGHYKYQNKVLTMNEAIDKKFITFVTLSSSTSTQKIITITSIAGMPDRMEISELNEPTQQSLIESTSSLEPLQVGTGLIYDPATALIISTTGNSENVIEAVKQGVIPEDSVKIVEPKSGKQISLKEAVSSGILDLSKGTYRNSGNNSNISLVDAAKIGLISVIGAPLVGATKIIQVVKNTMVKDPTTGEELPMEVAYERGLVDPITYKNYEESMREKTPDSSTETVLLSHSEQTNTNSKPLSIGAAVSEGFITVESIQNSLTANNFNVLENSSANQGPKSQQNIQITKSLVKPKYGRQAHESVTKISHENVKPTVLQKLRKRILVPEDAVAMGLLDESTAKILTNIKLCKDKDGSEINLGKAIENGLIDANSGKIRDPVHGDVITIKDALDRGILDSEGQNEVLIPIVRGLSIPEILQQGLYSLSTGKIIHPETGSHLSLREAIICDIVDPLTSVKISNSENVSISDAIRNNLIDAEKNLVNTSEGPIDFITAVNSEIFPELAEKKSNIPPAAMSLTVALQQNIMNPKTGSIKHPLTGEIISLGDAISKDLLMGIPYPQTVTTKTVEEALQENLLNLSEGTYLDPNSKETVSLEQALEKGLVAVKRDDDITEISGVVTTVTETLTSQHTITTKMIELLADFVLINSNEVKNVKTGEVMSIVEARRKGIIKDEQTTKEQFMSNKTNFNFDEALNLGYVDIKNGTFTNPNTGEILTITEAVKTGLLNTEVTTEINKITPIKETDMLDLNEAFELLFDTKSQKFRDPKSPNKVVSFEEALDRNIINPESVIFDVKSSQPMTVKEALNSGFLDKKSGKIKQPDSGKSIDIKKAAKLGLVAVVAAPVVAGMAMIQGVKSVASNISKPLHDAAGNKQDKKSVENKESENLKPQVQNITDISEKDKFKSEKFQQDTLVTEKPNKASKPSSEISKANVSSTDDSKIKKSIISSASDPEETKDTNVPTQKVIDSNIVHTNREQSPGLVEAKNIQSQSVVMSTESEQSLYFNSKNTSQPKGKVDEVTIKDSITKKDKILTDTINKKEEDILLTKADVIEKTKLPKVIKPHFESQNTNIESDKNRTLLSISDNKTKVPSKLQGITEKENVNIDETDKSVPKEINIKSKESLSNIKSFETMQSPHSYEENKSPENNVIFNDPNTSLIISEQHIEVVSTTTGRQILTPELVSVMDPNSGQQISFKDAIQKGIVDTESQKIKSQSGKKISIADAAKIGLIAVVGAPIFAVSKAIDAVKGTASSDVKVSDTKNIDIVKGGPGTGLTRSDAKIIELVEDNDTRPSKTFDKNSQDKTITAMFIDAEKQPLRAIDEIIEQNVTKLKSNSEPILYENITLIDAIAQGKIEPKVCRILVNGVESPYTVQDALEQEQISRFATVDVLSKNCIVLKETRTSYSVSISQKLTPEELAEMGVYDIERQIFIDPKTGVKISFEQLIYGLKIFDPKTILVKDLSSQSDNYIPFNEAISRPIIDKITGHMVNPKTGKRVPFLECVQMGWIVETPEEVLVPEQVTIESALERGLYNSETGEIKDLNTGEVISIGDAVQKGLLDQESLLIKVPGTNEEISISDALERGIIEIRNGEIIIIETQEVIEISVAIQKGFITIIRRPISMEALIVKELYEPNSGKFKDDMTNQLVTVEDAVIRNIVHPTISEIKDTETEKYITLSEAIDSQIINPKTGKLKDKKTGQIIPLDDAFKRGLIATKTVTFSLFDVIELGYYSPYTCRVLNPKTGDTITLKDAIESKLVDPSHTKVKDDKQDSVIPFEQAVKCGLIDLEQGIITSPQYNLKDASDKGYLFSDTKPWSLQESLVQGCYDQDSGLLTINDVAMTLDDAIKVGNINPEAITARNSVTGEMISLQDAINSGIIDSKEGKVRDPVQGDKISLTDASERGLILPAKRKLSLPEAVFKGFYDPKTGKFSHPQSKDKMQMDRAIRKRMLDPQSTLVHVGGKVIPFEFAVDKGIVDGRTGTITLGDERVDFREAFERGILVEVRKPLSLVEALEKGIYNEITGLFMDPQSGKKHTLIEAIKMNLIDPNSVHIQDNRLGKWSKISLLESIETGVIDDKSGKIKNINNDNEQITLRKAFEIGLLVDSKAPVSLQRAIHQGLYDDDTRKIVDPITSRKITLHEAIRRSIISPKYLCYFDKKSEKPLTLSECCRSQIVDRRTGKFIEPGSDVQVTLSEAMTLGLIVDIESAGFTLYETLAMDMYNIMELVFIHPVTERKISLKAAITEELINPEISLIKHIPSSRYITLVEAIQTGIVDETHSVYILPNGNQINLLDAKHRGLIVTSKKGLSLEEVIRNGLFRSDNGKIVDPNSNEFIDITKAIEIGLINPELTIVKDTSTNKFNPLLTAIQQGDVDVSKGRVLDTKAKKTFNLDIAFDKGLLVSVIQPITLQSGAKRFVPDSSISKEPVLREFTLEDAIKYEFIDPKSALIKDPHKNKYVPLEVGINDCIVDKSAKGLIDTQSGRSQSRCFVFENGLIIYKIEPFTFEQSIELGYLNIANARFTDPQSNEILTIKDAASLGYIDPDTALIKDNLKKRLIKLPEAFRKGLMDAEKGNIVDTETSKLNSLSAAIDSGLLMTPKKSFSLIETLNFGIYNPTTGALNDPFITTSVMDRKRLTLGEAIQQGIVDASSTVVKEPETGKIWPLVQAIEQKLVNPNEGRLVIDPKKGISLDLCKALKKGYLLPAETRPLPAMLKSPFELKRECLPLRDHINDDFKKHHRTFIT
ncbi:plectin isoform X9 [Aricia agestis]|uniref:plectin isoform X9 n=1 Tax=Aricia agestis TaxID=91739 RepID=UPI001C201FAB|nr:plectin isoform X9 [Aricia agestis]